MTETKISGHNPSAAPGHTPTLLYDGKCGFCRTWVDYWRELTGSAVQYIAMQHASGQLADAVHERGMGAVLLVEPDGNVTSGAQAVFKALATVPGKKWPLAFYEHVPGF